jgi:tripartite-type tricarboxylate transporter receptor subunit TctC
MKKTGGVAMTVSGMASLCGTAAFVAAIVAHGASAADAYPTKPVRLIVGFVPGGANDLVARVVAAKLTPRLGQQVIVENRAGAGGNVATQLAARAAPDGYTMLLGTVATHAMAPALYKDLQYDVINDFAMVTQLVGVSTLIAVHPTVPARTLKEYVALAKRRPGKLSFATPGAGSISHLSGEMFIKAADIAIVHVPYKGGGPAMLDVMSGQVETLIGLISTGAPSVQAGKLRGLAGTAAHRSTVLPDVPTVAEAGYPGFEASGWLGLMFPAKTPAAILERMYKEAAAVMAAPEVRDQLQNAGIDPAPSNPEAFRSYVQSEGVKWARLIREARITVQ